jgi:hypothetical protein
VGNRPPITPDSYSILAGTTASAAFLNKNIKYSPKPTGTPPPTGGWYTVLPLSVEEGGADGRCQILAPLYRLADVYTLRAEALNQLGYGTQALELVNNIRKRVGYMADATQEVDNYDKSAVEWLILEERKLDFVAEGRRWFDLCRTNRVMEVMDPVIRLRQAELGFQVTGWTDPGRILAPINSREFEANPALVQNPSYSGGAD